MIILAGTLTLDPAEIPAFRDALAAMRPTVLTERGCHHYSLLVEDEPGGVVNVCEIWEDDAALAEHLAQPWIAAFFQRFKPHIRALDAKLHDVAGVRDLPPLE
jgi:quinol monooxygenase YgiN